MSRTYEQVVVVASGGTQSGIFGMRNADSVGINFPTITSAQAYLMVAPSSAGPFGRMFRTDGSTTAALNIGAGSNAALVELVPFAFAKVELSVAQADNRSLSITTRF